MNAATQAVLDEIAEDVRRTCIQAHKAKIADLMAERDRIMARLKEKEKKAAKTAAEDTPPIPYAFPKAKCSLCNRSYRQLKKGGRRWLSINDMKYVRPSSMHTSSILCPDCKKEIFGTMTVDGPGGMATKAAKFAENPTAYPFITSYNEKFVQADAQALHTLQKQNDTLLKQQRLQADRERQAAQAERLIRRATQTIQLMQWVLQEKSFDLLEGARVVILDGTNAKQAERDRWAVVRAVAADLKIACPLPHRVKGRLIVGTSKLCVHGVARTERCPKCRVVRRHGRQSVDLKPLPGSAASGPAQPLTLDDFHSGHQANTRYHVETIEIVKPGPANAKKGTKTLEYTKPPMQATASKVGDAVAALYRAPMARSLQTELGEEVDLADASQLSRPVQELLAAEGLTHYANEGVKLYPLTFDGDTYTVYLTQSLEQQVYVVVYDGVLGWALYTETADNFTLVLHKGSSNSTPATTYTAQNLTAYPDADRAALVTMFDFIIFTLTH